MGNVRDKKICCTTAQKEINVLVMGQDGHLQAQVLALLSGYTPCELGPSVGAFQPTVVPINRDNYHINLFKVEGPEMLWRRYYDVGHAAIFTMGLSTDREVLDRFLKSIKSRDIAVLVLGRLDGLEELQLPRNAKACALEELDKGMKWLLSAVSANYRELDVQVE